MELTTIKASKIYKSSSRKSKILSAFSNPLNSELIQQLDGQINKPREDEKLKESTEDVEVSKKPVEDDVLDNSTEPESNKSSVNVKNISHDEDKISEDNNNVDGDSDKSKDSEDVVKDQPVEESTEVVAEDEIIERSDDISSESKDIKGLLNMREDTKGVNRILTKNKSEDPELWIYYNDEVNLNVVMGTVIEVLNEFNYEYLQFNRLARSDNAIVFLILKDGEYEDKKTIEEIKEVSEDN